MIAVAHRGGPDGGDVATGAGLADGEADLLLTWGRRWERRRRRRRRRMTMMMTITIMMLTIAIAIIIITATCTSMVTAMTMPFYQMEFLPVITSLHTRSLR
jgi:hypothetical protein